MYEIKKIIPSSLAKYCSLVMAIIVFILSLISFILGLAGIGLRSGISWDQQLISFLVSVIFFYVFFWVIGYLFALIYNAITAKTRGVIIEFNLIDKSISEEIKKDKKE